MKMVILSDVHLGRYKYGKMHSSGVDLRTLDILDNVQEAFDYAKKNNADSIAILGDFYHTKRPAQIFRRFLSIKLEWALKNNIKLYLLLGNHDQGKSHGHDIVELVELSSQIKNLEVVETPKSIETQDSILCFLPHVNIFDLNISEDKFHSYLIEEINKLSEIAKKSTKKNKIFFGHFGTDKSVAGKSFDLGTDSKSSRVLPLAIFDPQIWTRVYLGDIHKPQELNEICRHPGSIAKVDFGEEGEKKGFYFFNDGNDEFVEVDDREFRTLHLNLSKDARATMEKFCEEIQDEPIDDCITRLKIDIKETDKKLISFIGLEEYLKEASWNYVGKSLIEIREDREDIQIKNDGELNYVSMFRDYTKKLKLDDEEDLIKSGEELLLEIQSTKE